MRLSKYAPEPPIELPPARTVHVHGRGEFFIRDSGEPHPGAQSRQPPLLLLHGWMATADLNWGGAYDELIRAGYRVLAIDHRGHGRGLRALVPFRLADCAADAAAVLRELDTGPAIVAGYSMGGAIAQLFACDHSDVLAGLILSGTAQHWQDPALKRYWLSMGAFGFSLAMFPSPMWTYGLGRVGFSDSPVTAWIQSELMRHSAKDVAEAGRELSRFDSRPWLHPLEVPAAVVVTTRDRAVPARKQRELAQALQAPTFDAPVDHLEVTTMPSRFNPALLAALEAVGGGRSVQAA